ncbi:MAG: hypothetical protein KatS3mg101_0419 [Patescibacteria group bacterium]|nr:MAG: hypothetical protein KatS3mg101_0419 [Patescibacteria group bacterium]
MFLITLKKNKKGFTLIELVIVVAVIGVLSGLILNAINVQGVRQKGRDAQRKAALKQIQTALELYYTEFRRYPNSGGAYISASTSSGLGATLNSSYISQLPADPSFGTAVFSSGNCSSPYGYSYRSDGASRYILLAKTEIDESAADSRCSTFTNICSNPPTGLGWGCNCSSNCYAVQNPL